jgi:HNH endonuclease
MTKIHHTLAPRTVVTENGCIEWTGCRTTSGYGRITIGYITKRVHRVSYEFSIGPIPSDMCVLHRCDNPPCLNPDHLFLGTNKENTHDMLAKGRHNPPVGERNGNTKLTPQQVLKIRVDTRSCAAIAEEYGISTSMVWNIRTRKAWKSLT